MKNLQDLTGFNEKSEKRCLDISINGAELWCKEKTAKSFIISDRQEVLKMILDSLPNKQREYSFDKQEFPECKGYNSCLSEIKEIINNLTNKIK